MANKILIGVFIIAAIMLVGVFLGGLTATTQPVSTSNVTISDFTFSEVAAGPAKFAISIENNKIVFEGPIAKPTPCNGLTANYTVSGNTVNVYVETTSFEGFCAQVIAETFYKGSFSVSDMPSELTIKINYGGNVSAEGSISAEQPTSTKERSCINSGGNVTTGMCCGSVSDFPGTCVVGACGCSLENSHSVELCDCGEGKCFNGNTCTEICSTPGCPTF